MELNLDAIARKELQVQQHLRLHAYKEKAERKHVVEMQFGASAPAPTHTPELVPRRSTSSTNNNKDIASQWHFQDDFT